MSNKSIIHEIKRLDVSLFQQINKRFKNVGVDLTPMQVRILIILYNSDKLLCQKDLEEPISCNKSTLSSMISSMEKKGFIIRKVGDNDSRINHLMLTDKGRNIINYLEEDKQYIEQVLVDGINDDEYNVFMRVIDKIKNNMERI